MPFVHVRLSTPPGATVAAALSDGFTTLMADTLRKEARLTAVLVDPAGPASAWTVGAVAVPGAAHVEATITAGTSTEAEKAAFIAAAMDLLRATLGPLPEATYVVLREVAPPDWGYDGRTQASRHPGA